MNHSLLHWVGRLRSLAGWLLLAAAVAFLAYRLKFAPVSVIAVDLKPGRIVAEIMGTGTLEARVQTTISPRIQEQLREVLVDEGDWVKAGQVLVRLEDGQLRLQVEMAEAGRVAAQATLERVRIDEARARAIEQQAQRQHRRVSELIATEVASQEELDRAVEALEVATADVKRTRAATAEAESQLVAAERNLAFQQERLAYTEITSPYDGLVVRRDRDPGGVIIPGGSLLQLVSTNELWVSAWVDETAMAGLKPGQPARVVFRSEPARAFPGEVARLGRETDRETREFVVDVRVSELPAHWAVGQRAEVFIETGCQDSAPCLPIAFLSWRAGKPGVLALQDGRVQWREIQLGLRGRESVEVRGGLPPGAVVCRAREPQRVLKDGQRARATPPPASQP